jgi:hypothetical protein
MTVRRTVNGATVEVCTVRWLPRAGVWVVIDRITSRLTVAMPPSRLNGVARRGFRYGERSWGLVGDRKLPRAQP